METTTKHGTASCPDCGAKLVHRMTFVHGLHATRVRGSAWVHERSGMRICPPRIGVYTRGVS